MTREQAIAELQSIRDQVAALQGQLDQDEAAGVEKAQAIQRLLLAGTPTVEECFDRGRQVGLLWELIRDARQHAALLTAHVIHDLSSLKESRHHG